MLNFERLYTVGGATEGHTEICVSPAVTCESYVCRLPQVSRRYSEETAGLASVTQICARGLWRDYGPIVNNRSILVYRKCLSTHFMTKYMGG